MLSPEAYLHTLSGGEPARLPDARPWALGLLVVFLLLIVVSFPLWWDAVGELSDLLASLVGTGG